MCAVSHSLLHGAPSPSTATSMPSTYHFTATTSLEASAPKVVMPVTAAPAAGSVTLTVGAACAVPQCAASPRQIAASAAVMRDRAPIRDLSPRCSIIPHQSLVFEKIVSRNYGLLARIRTAHRSTDSGGCETVRLRT